MVVNNQWIKEEIKRGIKIYLETFSRIDHILGQKSSLSKFNKTEIISSIFSKDNVMGQDINYRGKNVKHQTHED